MHKVILLSALCPGLPLGVSEVSGIPYEVLLLPPGKDLLERVNSLPGPAKLETIAIVTLLTDLLESEQIVQLKDQLPKLRLLANYAVGYNNIDIKFAQKAGILVSNTPRVLGDATADLTFTLMLMVARRAWPGALQIHQTGSFPGWTPTYGLGTDLRGKTLGIVGLGDIGLRVSRRAFAFGMKVVALNSLQDKSPTQPPYKCQEFVIERLSEQDFFQRVDVLSLHCPLTSDSRGWLNDARISSLKHGAIVINTARGDLVDERALADALKREQLFGAGLDVFCGEPVLSEVLRGVPNLVVLPHLGSATVETREAMGTLVLKNIHALISGCISLPTQVLSS